ncbi:MAG: polymerase protein [Apis picorna-like virus 1]|nr:MAG: polymerase protein [Apis picorna-like virus 1]
MLNLQHCLKVFGSFHNYPPQTRMLTMVTTNAERENYAPSLCSTCLSTNCYKSEDFILNLFYDNNTPYIQYHGRNLFFKTSDHGCFMFNDSDSSFIKQQQTDILDVTGDGIELARNFLEQLKSSCVFSHFDEQFLQRIESFVFCIVNLSRTNDPVIAFSSCCSFLNSCSKKSISSIVLVYIKKLVFACSPLRPEGSFEVFENFISITKIFSGEYDNMLNSAFVLNLKKLFMYMLSFSVFNYFGLSFESFDYNKFEIEAIRREFKFGPQFIKHLLDFCVFVGERGISCYKLGSFSPFFASAESFRRWNTKSMELLELHSLSESGAISNFDIFKFRVDLLSLIEEGDLILKFDKEITGFEKKLVSRTLSSLRETRLRDLTVKSCLQMRKLPFGILLAGPSSVGKSVLTTLLFQHYAKVHKLSCEEEYKYVRNAATDFWDNFKTHQWCILLDDIGFLKPGASGAVDETVLELIRIMNNVPYCPNQASLEDKGRTPVQAKLVIGTTNRMDLHANSYFTCPYAIQRRFPVTIDVSVKPEYSDSHGMLDSFKIDNLDGSVYPDYWIFRVYKIEPSPSNRDQAVPRLDRTFDDINSFVQWLSFVSIEHEKVQEQIMVSKDVTRDIHICDYCLVPCSGCTCDQAQWSESSSDSTILSQGGSPYSSFFNERNFKEFDDPQFSRSIHELQSSDYFKALSLDEQEVLLWKQMEDYRTANNMLSYINYVPDCGILTPNFNNWRRILTKCVSGLRDVFLYFILFWYNLFHCLNLLTVRPRISIDLFGFEFLVPSFVSDCVFRNLGIKFRFMSHQNYDRARLRFRQAIAVLSAFACAYGLYRLFKKPKFVTQGVSSSIGVKPTGNDERVVNPWFDDSYKLSSLDISRKSLSMKGLDNQRFMEVLSRNCFDMQISDSTGLALSNRTLALGGHYFVTNYHTICKFQDVMEVVLYSRVYNTGISPTRRFTLNKSMMYHLPDRDLSFFQIKEVPPCKNIMDLFPSVTYKGIFDATLLGVTAKIGMKHLSVKRAHKKWIDVDMHPKCSRMYAWCGIPSAPTTTGDCGAVLFSDAQFGKVILGIHCAGDPKSTIACSAPIYSSDFSEMFAFFGDEIMEPSAPELSSSTCQRELINLHRKSPVRFIAENGTAEVYGSFSGFRPQMKSNVAPTLICSSMVRRGYDVKYGRPLMSGWIPRRIALLSMTQPPYKFRPDILEICRDSFLLDIFENLSDEDFNIIEVYDNDTAINGAVGVRYLDRLKLNTSAGLPWRTPKRALVSRVDDDRVEFCDEVMDRVDDIIDKYHNGELYSPVFSAQLKDEPTSEKKIREGKTRVFCGAPVDWSIVVRKYCLSMVRLIQSNRYTFECGPGFIVQSSEWQDLAAYLTAHGMDQIVAGDYKNFDKSMTSSVMLMAFDILKRLGQKGGYSKLDMKVLDGIAEDTSFPLIDFFGDLIKFYNSNPSGQPLTVIINSFVNSLYMRYAYFMLNPEHEVRSFKSNVKLMTYGDDNIMGVSVLVPWFNHSSIAAVLAAIGVDYTMADKEEASRPYISINESTFLKRTFRYDEDIGAVVAPLSHDSIEKSLTSCVISKSVCAEEQCVSIISSAIREYFYYGKQIYEAAKIMFQEVILENNLQPYVIDATLPPYELLLEQFWEASDGYKCKWPMVTGQECKFKPKVPELSDPCYFKNRGIFLRRILDSNADISCPPEQSSKALSRAGAVDAEKPRPH